MNKNHEEKMVRILRILLIYIPIIIWVVSTVVLFFLYPASALFFGGIALLILIPWCLFLNWFIK